MVAKVFKFYYNAFMKFVPVPSFGAIKKTFFTALGAFWNENLLFFVLTGDKKTRYLVREEEE